MWSRIKIILKPTYSKQEFYFLKESILKISKNSSTLCLYGAPTQGSWLGIANATKSIYADCSVTVPQYYSNSILTDKQTKEICEFIKNIKFDRIIISGFAPYFYNWIDLLYPTSSVEILFHGTISEFHEKSKQELINKMILYGKNKKIARFGFVKKGLEDVFIRLYDLDAFHQPLPFPTIPDNIDKLNLDKNKIHIGVFGANTFNKNLHNQVIHALMMENTIIHVLDKSIFSYLQMGDRIVEHGKNLTHKQFCTILGSMNLNLYMSYNESWGLVAYESEALQVPCVKMDDLDYLRIIMNNISNSNKK